MFVFALSRRAAIVGRLAAVIGGLAIAGCSGETSLLVEVVSDDLTVPDNVDALEMDVHGEMSTHDLMSGVVTLPGPFPHSYRVHAAGGFESEMVTVTVVATRSGAFVERRVVEARFVPGTTNT